MKPRPASHIDIPSRVRMAVAAALDRKAQDPRVFEMSTVTPLTDYFLFLTGASQRQVQAIADAVEEQLRGDKVRPLHVEGYGPAQWILMDYGDFIVHIFQDEKRRFYGLERLWGDAPDVTEQFC